jgi:hypothetical protein
MMKKRRRPIDTRAKHSWKELRQATSRLPAVYFCELCNVTTADLDFAPPCIPTKIMVEGHTLNHHRSGKETFRKPHLQNIPKRHTKKLRQFPTEVRPMLKALEKIGCTEEDVIESILERSSDAAEAPPVAQDVRSVRLRYRGNA